MKRGAAQLGLETNYLSTLRPSSDSEHEFGTNTPFGSACLRREEGKERERRERRWTVKPTSLFRSSFRIFLFFLLLSIQENTPREKPEGETSWPCPTSLPPLPSPSLTLTLVPPSPS